MAVSKVILSNLSAEQASKASWKTTKQKRKTMTIAARTIQSSPLAPYMDLMRSVDISVKHALVEYMNESIREAEEDKRKAEDEFLAKKIAEMKISPRISKLIDETRLMPEEAQDERTRHILGLDRR